jgi:hypothetical protein
MNVSPTTIPGLGSGVTTTGPFSISGSGSVSSSSSALSSGASLASLFSVLAELLAVVVVVGLVGVFVIVVVANRADPDPSGRRPQSVYYFAVSFITLVASILGSAVVVVGIVRLIGRHSGSITDSVARTIVIGGLITGVSLVLLITHLRRGLVLARAEDAPSPSRRVGQSYVSAVAFLSIISLLVASVVAIYLVFALAGPGVFGSFGGRTSSLRYLIVALYLGGVAVLVLGTHRNLVSPGLALFARTSDAIGTSDAVDG